MSFDWEDVQVGVRRGLVSAYEEIVGSDVREVDRWEDDARAFMVALIAGEAERDPLAEVQRDDFLGTRAELYSLWANEYARALFNERQRAWDAAETRVREKKAATKGGAK